MPGYLLAASLMGALFAGQVMAGTLDIPFDFSRGAIGLDVTVNGTPLFFLLDTGVDPSIIDHARAESLGLKIHLQSGGEASGYGESKSAAIFPTTLDGLAIGGRSFRALDALAADTSAISRGFGREIDGVLGFSFLADKIVLIDYDSQKVELLDHAADADSNVRPCHMRWMTAMELLDGDNTPIIPAFRLGGSAGPASLDTGSNGGISLFDRALSLPGIKAALNQLGETDHTGARGVAKSATYAFGAPVGFGPFSLPAGQIVNRMTTSNTSDKRLANIGNRLFAEMKLKILLNYRTKKLVFYGDCHAS